jgi:putative glutathione S-transferase
VRPKETEHEIDQSGAFVRQKNRFVTPFGEKEGELKAEPGRYRLAWAYRCNWSNRASIVRELLGLEEVISATVVDYGEHDENLGWEFVNDPGGRDAATGAQFLSELYANADPEYIGRPTVPALIDVTEKKVVNNDYHHLTNYLEVAFKPYQKPDAPDLYPEALRKEIDERNVWLFQNVNNGVYRCFFAQTIEAYNEAFDRFFDSLDYLEQLLGIRRFLFGDYVTDSDVRLYVTLARFDSHYFENLGPVKHRLVDYKNLWGYARDLWAIPAFRNNTYFREFTKPDYPSPNFFKPYTERFADQIDFEGLWGQPARREYLSQDPEHKFLVPGLDRRKYPNE